MKTLWALSVIQLKGLNDVQEEVQCMRTNWSLTVSLTALCKLGHKRRPLKKRKIDYFWKKKNGQGLEISLSVIGKRNEKKFQTFAMWSTQSVSSGPLTTILRIINIISHQAFSLVTKWIWSKGASFQRKMQRNLPLAWTWNILKWLPRNIPMSRLHFTFFVTLFTNFSWKKWSHSLKISDNLSYFCNIEFSFLADFSKVKMYEGWITCHKPRIRTLAECAHYNHRDKDDDSIRL